MSRVIGFASMLWEMAIMAGQYLAGRKLRTALTSLAIVFGVALIFAFNLVMPSALAAFRGTMTAAYGAADFSISSTSGQAFSPDKPLQTVAAVKHVKAVTGVLRRRVALPTGTAQTGSLSEASQIELVGIDPATAQGVFAYPVSEGRFLQPGDTSVAVGPADIAEIIPQLKVGATFPLVTTNGQQTYTIVGWLAQKTDPTAPQIIIPLSDAQAVFNQPGQINAIDVALEPGANRDAVAKDIQQALGPDYSVNSTESAPDAFAAVQVGYAIFDVMGLIALFLGAFLIFNTFRTVVVERRRDLGLLRAVGATRRHLTEMILVESLVQGVLGTVGGLVLGCLFALGMSSFMSSFISKFMTVRQLQISITPSSFALPVAAGLVTTLIAGFWPARTAGRISPLAALRPALTADIRRTARWMLIAGIATMGLAILLLMTSDKTTAVGAVVFLVGMVIAAPGLVLPVARVLSPLLTLWFVREGDLARGNLTRQPGRAAITASTLMIGLATLILIAAIVASFNSFLSTLVDRSFSSDLILTPPTIATYGNVVGADENLIKRLRAVPQVDTAAGLRYATSTYNGQGLEVLGIDPVAYPKVAPFAFVKGRTDEAYGALATGRAAILNGLTASTLKLDVGSEFTMQTAEGPQTYRVAGIANDLMHFKLTAVFISQANMTADFHKTEDVLYMINLKPGADKTAALAAVQQIAADYPQFTVRLTGEYRDVMTQMISSAFVLFWGMAALILIPAGLGLLNTLTINVLERTREIGVVRAVGGTRGQVKRMVLAEALLLGLFGAGIGTLAGVAMSYGFIAAFSGIGWNLPYEFPLFGIIAAIVVAVVLAILASILPARNAAKLDIIRALQYE